MPSAPAGGQQRRRAARNLQNFTAGEISMRAVGGPRPCPLGYNPAPYATRTRTTTGHRRHPARDVPRRIGGDGGGHGGADRGRRAGRGRPLQLGLLRLPAHLHHHRSDVRQARRPLRPQAHLSLVGGDLPDRLGALRRRPYLSAAHPLPRHPGARRRRSVAGRHHHHRRHLHPGRARAHPGDLLRNLGGGEPDRPAARRRDHRHPLLAVDLLPQHPLRPALRL